MKFKIPKKVKQFGKKAAKAVDNAVDAVVDKTKEVSEKAGDVLAEPFHEAAGLSGELGNLQDKVERGLSKFAGKLGGKRAEKVVEDVLKIINPLGFHATESFLESVSKFLDTGDIQYLDPLVGILASELEKARNSYWSRAQSIPKEVTVQMPPDLQDLLLQTRCIAVAETSYLSLPTIAIDHLNKASAITTLNLIVFDQIPGATEQEDLHLWAHEIFHVKQFADWGKEGFAKRYVKEVFTGSSEENEVELDADRFACQLFPIPHPTYLKGPCSGSIN